MGGLVGGQKIGPACKKNKKIHLFYVSNVVVDVMAVRTRLRVWYIRREKTNEYKRRCVEEGG